MKSKDIEIESFNPYESIFPNRKLINFDTILLIKMLRKEGYNVIVKPNDGTTPEYLFRKGAIEFLSNPINALIVNVNINIACNLIASWIQGAYKKEKPSHNIFIIDNSQNKIVNVYERTISKQDFLNKKKKRESMVISFQECFKMKSPIPGLPTPIFLEHKPIIIGWCRLKNNENLEVEKGQITDEKIYEEMKKGIYKGFSISGIAEQTICSICNSNYLNCNHVGRRKYNGKICSNSISVKELIEISVVKEPINNKAVFKLL
jgi:hypothetical protein